MYHTLSPPFCIKNTWVSLRALAATVQKCFIYLQVIQMNISLRPNPLQTGRLEWGPVPNSDLVRYYLPQLPAQHQ